MIFETSQQFLSFVDANGGPEKLAMLVFNNSYTKVFGEGEVFNPAEDFDASTGLFRFVEYDIRRLEYVSYKGLLYLEGITFAGEGVDKDTINFRSFRP